MKKYDIKDPVLATSKFMGYSCVKMTCNGQPVWVHIPEQTGITPMRIELRGKLKSDVYFINEVNFTDGMKACAKTALQTLGIWNEAREQEKLHLIQQLEGNDG